MKKAWSVLLGICLVMVCLVLLGVDAQAAVITASGHCGENVTWSLDGEGLLTISGSGAMADYATASEAPWYTQRSEIQRIVVSDGVTTIGDRAFYNCTAVTEISIGNDVESIGTYAFRGCSVLTAVTVPAGVSEIKGSAFRACTNLTDVTLEGAAPEMGNYVFNDGAAALTVKYYEGSTGYDIAPWTSITHEPQHVGQWVVDVPATCTTSGTRHIDCTYCKETFTESYSIAHRYINGICEMCQEAAIIASGECGSDATWKLDVLGVLTISGSGDMYYWYYADGAPWYSYRSSIKTVEIENGITQISSYAFNRYTALTSVTIPDSITSIGICAFYGCSGLTSVTIPDSVTSIGDSAFYGCSSLKNVHINDLSAWLQIDFQYGPSNPLSNTGVVLYLDGEPVTEVIIPDSFSSIKKYVFRGYSGLTSVTIPDSVTYIGFGAFEDCSGLTSVTIPDSVTHIGFGAFEDCSGLTSVTIPDSVTYIGHSTFSGCCSLKNVHINDLSAWLQIDFNSGSSNPLSNTGAVLYLDGEPVTEVTILDNFSRIKKYLFYGYSSLTSVTIPDSVTSIGGSAFDGCTGLISVTIPDSVTSIGSFAFYGCSGLTSITFTGSAPSFGDYVFSGVYAKAYYPCNDATWTDSVRQNYDGRLSWKASHDLREFTVVEAATCTTDEVISGVCVCGETVTTTVSGTATGHSFGDNGICSACKLAGEIIIDMTDPFGDGWGGNMLKIYRDGVFVSNAMANDFTYQMKFDYYYGSVYTFLWNQGIYPEERRFTISLNHELLFSASGADCGRFTTGQTVYTLESACIHSYEPVVTPATCLGDGFTTYTCTVCGNSYISDSVPATGHSYEAVVTAPTCTAEGFTTYTCTACGDSYVDDSVSATGHIFDYWRQDKMPTCDQKGIVSRKCVNCEEREYIEVAALGHKYVEGYCTACGAKDPDYVEGCTFPDVPSTLWSYESIEFAVAKGYFSGYQNGNFGPSDSITRQDFVVVLARIAKVDLKKYAGRTGFPDVVPGSYYEAAVKWASSTGVVSGYNNGKFGVNDKITREQLVTILYRYAKKIGCDTSVSGNASSKLYKFGDAGKVTSYAKDAMIWALEKGVISGMTPTTVGPQNNASRGQVATILMNISKKNIMPI